MNIGEPLEIVEVEEPAIPYEGDEIPESVPEQEPEPEMEPEPVEVGQ